MGFCFWICLRLWVLDYQCRLIVLDDRVIFYFLSIFIFYCGTVPFLADHVAWVNVIHVFHVEKREESSYIYVIAFARHWKSMDFAMWVDTVFSSSKSIGYVLMNYLQKKIQLDSLYIQFLWHFFLSISGNWVFH